MPNSYVKSIVLYALVYFARGLDYSHLEALGLNCPGQDRCEGYTNNTPYWQRSCECDPACHTYKDCCIDAPELPSGQTAPENNMECLNYGGGHLATIYWTGPYAPGIYAVSTCSTDWDGPNEVKQKCEGPADLSDPVGAAPVTSTSEAVTYKNLCCAECNNADMASLKAFRFIVSCQDSWDMSEQRIMDELSYNEQKKMWGIKRLDARKNSNFTECLIISYVPVYLEKSVRFCRANIISKCAPNWTRKRLKRYCDEYMAVVLDFDRGYRNPHCALCNYKSVSDLSCRSLVTDRRIQLPQSAHIDINGKDDNGPKCAPDLLFDPFLRKCRRLGCDLPGIWSSTESLGV